MAHSHETLHSSNADVHTKPSHSTQTLTQGLSFPSSPFARASQAFPGRGVWQLWQAQGTVFHK